MTTETEPITLGSGEGRIVAEFLALRRGSTKGYYKTSEEINEIWLFLARKHKRPVRELKDLVNRYKAQKDPNWTMEAPDNRSEKQKRYQNQVCYCGETEGITWGPSPYESEIHGDNTPLWMCPECVGRSREEV